MFDNERAPIIDGGSDSGSRSKSREEAVEQGASKSKSVKKARGVALAKSGDLDKSGNF